MVATSALSITAIVQKPDAVLLDRRNQDLLLVFSPTGDPQGRGGKLVVHLNYLARVRDASERFSKVFNAVKSGGLVQRETLQDTTRFQVLEGSV